MREHPPRFSPWTGSGLWLLVLEALRAGADKSCDNPDIVRADQRTARARRGATGAKRSGTFREAEHADSGHCGRLGQTRRIHPDACAGAEVRRCGHWLRPSLAPAAIRLAGAGSGPGTGEGKVAVVPPERNGETNGATAWSPHIGHTTWSRISTANASDSGRCHAPRRDGAPSWQRPSTRGKPCSRTDGMP